MDKWNVDNNDDVENSEVAIVRQDFYILSTRWSAGP